MFPNRIYELLQKLHFKVGTYHNKTERNYKIRQTKRDKLMMEI